MYRAHAADLRASTLFRELVGDRALLYDAMSRYIYETVLQYEFHHTDQHADCEERSAHDLSVAIAYASGRIR